MARAAIAKSARASGPTNVATRMGTVTRRSRAAGSGVHAVWNAVASDAITQVLCGAPTPGAACTPDPAALDLLVTVPILVATFVGPLALVLFAIAARPTQTP